MPLLEVSNLTKYYGANLILAEISFQIDPGSKVGLIGPNGCGKTTLLNIIEGREDYDSGRITFQSGLQLGYLTQEPQFAEGLTVEGEMLAVFADLQAIADRISVIEHAMGDPLNQGNKDKLSALLDKYSTLRELFERGGGYEYRVRIRSVLNGLGLQQEFWDRQTASLSGGEKTRLSLAKLLLSEPDLLLLDEPTNYLDIQAVEWLEHFMRDYRGAVLAVSHDRYFLDRIAQRILEMEDHKITSYAGNYSSYQMQRQQLMQSWEKAYFLQQKEINRQEKMIRESRETEKAKKEANSRQKRLDLVQRIEKPPTEQDGIRLKFGAAHRSGKRVLEVEHLTKEFDNRQILTDVSFGLYAGDKIALLGPNGSGKTTALLELIAQVAGSGRTLKDRKVRCPECFLNKFPLFSSSIEFLIGEHEPALRVGNRSYPLPCEVPLLAHQVDQREVMFQGGDCEIFDCFLLSLQDVGIILDSEGFAGRNVSDNELRFTADEIPDDLYPIVPASQVI